VRVAVSGDPAAAVRARVESYRTNPLAAVHDLRALQRLVRGLQQQVDRQWGARERELPAAKRYVKYTQNYRSRAVVDFDRGLVRVETLDRERTGESLHNAIVTTLLTPDDPRAVDLFSAAPVTLGGRPYLHGLVLDHRGRPVATPRQAEAFARALRSRGLRQRQSDAGATITYVEIPMVSDHLARSARRYAPLVQRHAARHGLSRSLVFAIIRTESDFNPFAVSSAPAFGLMQLVPTTGGRDAYRALHGRDGVPTPDELFDPARNIELGSAYLGLLNREYLAGVHNPVSREYCTIAAYNGGIGTVLRVFHRDRGRAVAIINSLSPAEVYRRLQERLQRQETRRYLVKVLRARREFIDV